MFTIILAAKACFFFDLLKPDQLCTVSHQVLFTGVVDQAGEKVLTQLGGCMAKGVADMTCLVTDKVRRTVKFLCALAKGVPIVTTDWLEKVSRVSVHFTASAPETH